MNRVRMTIIWSLSIVFFVSCESAGDKRLDFALEQAGKNRIELEKVLNYYQNDSLKLEAARFLIRNMPGHGGYEDDRLDSVKAMMTTAVELNIGGYLLIANGSGESGTSVGYCYLQGYGGTSSGYKVFCDRQSSDGQIYPCPSETSGLYSESARDRCTK